MRLLRERHADKRKRAETKPEKQRKKKAQLTFSNEQGTMLDNMEKCAGYVTTWPK